MVMQRMTHRPVEFEIIEQTRNSVAAWIDMAEITSDEYLFPSRLAKSSYLSTRRYARKVRWGESIDPDAAAYGTHTMRRTKATLTYRRTKHLRVVQLLLDHAKLESSVRYLGAEVDDVIEITEQTEVWLGPVGVFCGLTGRLRPEADIRVAIAGARSRSDILSILPC